MGPKFGRVAIHGSQSGGGGVRVPCGGGQTWVPGGAGGGRRRPPRALEDTRDVKLTKKKSSSILQPVSMPGAV